jgi:membrane-bound ClpP family serine protease
MMLVILFVIALGLLLLFAELFIVPGVTFVGLAGALLLGLGVWHIYEQYGTLTGHLALLVLSILSGWVIWRSFKTRFWKKFELQQQIVGKSAVDAETLGLVPGQLGKAMTALRPQGTVKFGTLQIEVESLSGWVDKGTEVEIAQLEGKKVFIKTK